MTAETQRTGQGEVSLYLPGCDRYVVQVAFRVGFGIADGRWQEAVMERYRRGDQLRGSRGADHVTGHGLGRTDHGLACLRLAEGELESCCLTLVVQQGTGSVGIDIEHLTCFESGFFKRLCDGRCRCRAVGSRGGIMIRVAGIAVSGYFGDDVRTAFYGMAVLFEHEHGGAFRHDEAATPAVERKAGLKRIRRSGEGLDVGEASEHEGRRPVRT